MDRVIILCNSPVFPGFSGLRPTQSASTSLRVTNKNVITINKIRNLMHIQHSISWYVSTITLHFIRNYSIQFESQMENAVRSQSSPRSDP